MKVSTTHLCSLVNIKLDKAEDFTLIEGSPLNLSFDLIDIVECCNWIMQEYQ